MAERFSSNMLMILGLPLLVLGLGGVMGAAAELVSPHQPLAQGIISARADACVGLICSAAVLTGGLLLARKSTRARRAQRAGGTGSPHGCATGGSPTSA